MARTFQRGRLSDHCTEGGWFLETIRGVWDKTKCCAYAPFLNRCFGEQKLSKGDHLRYRSKRTMGSSTCPF
jgi:hypothetical protein